MSAADALAERNTDLHITASCANSKKILRRRPLTNKGLVSKLNTFLLNLMVSSFTETRRGCPP
jgi:hypothetical protein